MDYIKLLGKFGLIISFLVFVLLFVQNSFNSDLIKDAVEYNLLYSYNIEQDDEYSVVAICFKNNGIKSLENIKFNCIFNDEVDNVQIYDTLSFSLTSPLHLVLKNYLIYYDYNFYPSECRTLLIKFHNKNNKITRDKISLFVSSKYTNGIEVKNAFINQEINYSNLGLYIQGANKLLWLIAIRLVLPVLGISLIIFILCKLIIKIGIVRKIIDFFK
jgi:hypothetical protein